MNSIYITTAHTGYNYGTYLQAYAMKKLMGQFADNSEIVWEKSFGPTGRDFRIKKIFSMCVRSVLHYKQISAIKQGYSKNFAAEPTERTKLMFDEFSENYLKIKEYSYRQLKSIAADSKTRAVVCGSDQIWNASSMYPDPLYYLQFAPQNKRIAFAPSFGRSVPVMPDPTIVVNWDKWFSERKENYILLYFLDEPSLAVVNDIKRLKTLLGGDIKVLLHPFESLNTLCNVDVIDAGPKEFVEIVSKARFVCTDSFHATIFSILSKTCFCTYPRNYGSVANQSSRIETLLNHYSLSSRYKVDNKEIAIDCDFGHVDNIIRKDREIANRYIEKCLLKISCMEE